MSVVHELPLERRNLHGHFSRDLAPVLTVDPGDSIVSATLNAGWRLESDRELFDDRDPELDAGHALCGPVEVRGALPGGTLAVHVDELRVGPWGVTWGGGFPTPLNERLGVADGETRILHWTLDADAGIGHDQVGREVTLHPFLGVIGMPPPEPGVHPTAPPRRFGGNIDCSELAEGTTLYLPIPVEGALLSFGDGHARQGDGEVSQLAIEAPMERTRLTVSLADFELEYPVAHIDGAWVTFGFDEDLDEAAALAIEGMLDLMRRDHGLERRDALALASVVVDLRVTQLVNGVRGIHAILRDDALR
ncbi:MAG TPA: acetamidase/formamidase family protein [Gaiellaceae bacterium]|nr:acetamidase/formamidase family protein [Gaiellaceae bacterium]